jgi:hypothetical protein
MKPKWTDREALQVYKRATGDNPWGSDRDADDRKTIAEEMRKVAAAKTIKEAVGVIIWWGHGEEETRSIVRLVRREYDEWRKLHRKVTHAFESGWKSAMKTTHRRRG